ncbi:MAG: tetratricopeptide repeat protein [Desulfatitalea sp.]|nr:tetratricopeptide repeat protein [Desulfatitalea sp.]NNK01416.1 tetratricopeptide repeat protein [Desulfatitalea sp.]
MQSAKPATVDRLNQALALRHAGRSADFLSRCRQLVEEVPEDGDAWFLMAVAEHEQGRPAQAEAAVTRAIRFNGHQPAYVNLLGILLIDTGRPAEAENVLRQALQAAPDAVDLRCNLGRALMHLRCLDDAELCFKQVLAADARHTAGLANLALLNQSRGRPAEAVDLYRRALEADPNQPDWHANLGAALLSRGDTEVAADAFRRALALTPGHPVATKGLGVACSAKGGYDEAMQVLEPYVQSAPEDAEAVAALAQVYQHSGRWQAYAAILPHLARQTEQALANGQTPAEQPLFNISRTADPALNLAVAQAWSRQIARRARKSALPFTHQRPFGPSDSRLTIGYLSADFRSHAVAHQLVSVFELHDRSRFRICGFSAGNDALDDYGRRIAAACDHFQEIAHLDAGDGARAVRQQAVDVLVDLTGHTDRNRLDICALRPAPVQIGYLGFLASSGADFIDYMIGDPVVIPDDHLPHYSEGVIRLAGCYQAISPAPKASRSFTRHHVDLPPDAFVFCCFNQLYKIDDDLFRCWMAILRRVPQSVLWLYGPEADIERRLRQAAATLGVRPDRLVFGKKLPLADHLVRLRLADLALDTPRYNGGATTANALTAGVPLITVPGGHFVSRMSASHLIALGLESLVAKDLDHYAGLAVDLAQSPERLAAVRQALRHALAQSPLLDTAAFVRNLEQVYQAVWQRHCAGRPAEHINMV